MSLDTLFEDCKRYASVADIGDRTEYLLAGYQTPCFAQDFQPRLWNIRDQTPSHPFKGLFCETKRMTHRGVLGVRVVPLGPVVRGDRESPELLVFPGCRPYRGLPVGPGTTPSPRASACGTSSRPSSLWGVECVLRTVKRMRLYAAQKGNGDRLSLP